MRHLSAILWLLPAAVHIAYILATYSKLPATIGVGPDSGGSRTDLFLVEWFAVLGLANLLFAGIHIRLPRLGDRMLSVPGKKYWLAGPEHRAELVDRLRGVCETILLMLNVFFLAVYQAIYQSNVKTPVITIQPRILIACFMVVPVLLMLVSLINQLRILAARARKPVDDS